MLQVWVIVIFAAVYLRDSMPGPPIALNLGSFDSFLSWRLSTAAATLGGMLGIALSTHILVRWSAWRLMHRRSESAIITADRVLWSGQAAAVLLHLFATLFLGWTDVVRLAVGDLIAVDELLAVTPVLLTITAGWWSFYPIDRFLREAASMRTLDSGAVLYSPPTARQYVWSNVRHGLLLTAAPLTLILIWVDSLDRLGAWALAGSFGAPIRRLAATVDAHHLGGTAHLAAQLLGVAVVFMFTPAIMSRLWDTIPLPPGELRDRLMTLCNRYGVRVRNLLVWRTHGALVNGAVMGFVGRFRYILLTDALLDSLTTREVEAVMAHEVAHVRRRHIPWMIVSMIAILGAVSIIVELTLSLAGVTIGNSDSGPLHQALELVGGILLWIAAMLAFGLVSRRFEWQADAFAAAHLSESTAPPHEPSSVQPSIDLVTPAGSAAMIDALEAVARLNHVPRHEFSWRHGSIAVRQHRLAALVGLPIRSLPIDRTVKGLKVAAGLTALAVVALLLISSLL
ncbi:MAG: M48 family metalloprotease [Phycisphaeraceae bacterium]|nr:M48 family metalloprotease [Phycisphaeraceae bacterium]